MIKLNEIDRVYINGEEVSNINLNGVKVWGWKSIITLAVSTKQESDNDEYYYDYIRVTASEPVKDDLEIGVSIRSFYSTEGVYTYYTATLILSKGESVSEWVHIGRTLTTPGSQLYLSYGGDIQTINEFSVGLDAYESDKAMYYEEGNTYVEI